MADYSGGLTGLFTGLSQGIDYINTQKKEEEAKRSKSEDLFIELLKNKDMKLKTGKYYKDGMTRIQVMNLFEESPEEETGRASHTQFYTPEEAKVLKGIFPELKGIPDDKVSTKLVLELRNSASLGLGKEKMIQKGKFDTDKIILEWQKIADKKSYQAVGVIQDIIKIAQKEEVDIDKLLSTDSKFRKTLELMLQPFGYSINDKPKNTTWQNFLGSLGRETGTPKGTTSEITAPKLNTSAPQATQTTTSGKPVPTGNTAADIKALAKWYNATTGLGVSEAISKAKAEFGVQSQTAVPSAMETDGGAELQQEFKKPSQQQSIGPTSMGTAPTQSQYMAKSSLPKLQQQAQDPNSMVLELAKKYRDKLANSPYPVGNTSIRG